MISESLCLLKGSRLKRIVASRMQGSWGTAFRRERNSCRGIVEMSRLSMRMVPEERSSMRKITEKRELLPLFEGMVSSLGRS